MMKGQQALRKCLLVGLIATAALLSGVAPPAGAAQQVCLSPTWWIPFGCICSEATTGFEICAGRFLWACFTQGECDANVSP